MMSNEDAEILKQFSQELASLYDSKPPVSKAKMVQLTKSAMKGIKFYKHVVMAVEKFIHRCKPEYKLPGLYVIDSIVRQSRHQFGTDKDVFAPRFCKNLENTLQSAASLCADEDRPKVVRIMNLWLQNSVFPEETIAPILADFKNMDVTVIPAAEEQSIALEKAKRKSEDKPSKNIPEALTPTSNPEKLSKLTGEKTQQSTKKETNNEQEKTEFLQQIQKLTSSLINQQKSTGGGGKKSKSGGGGDSDRKLTKKILSQYDYSDDDGDEVEELEEDGDDSVDETNPDKLNAGQNDSDLSLNFAHAAQNLLNNPQILQQIQKMQQTITRQSSNDASTAHGAAAPPPPVPAPNASFDFRSQGSAAGNKPVFDNQAYPPPAEPLPPGFDSSGGSAAAVGAAATTAAVRADRDERRRISAPNEESTSSSTKHSGDRDRRRRSSRDRSRSRSRDRKRKHRSRSRSKSPATAYSKRHKSTTNNSNNNNDENANKKDDDRDRDRDRERSRRSRSRGDRRDRDRGERDRRSRGMLSNVKAKHVSIYSRTLWFGKIPQSCEPDELKEILKEYGEPVSIDLIPPRGCAYVVMPDRKTAYKVLDSRRDLKLQNRILKKAWAMGKGVKNDFEEDWDADNGVTHIPWDRLRAAQPAHVDFLSLWVDGGTLDVESLPDDLKPFYDEKGRVASAGGGAAAAAAMVVRPGGGGPAAMPFCAPPGMFPTMLPPPGFPGHLAMAQQMFLANAGAQRPPGQMPTNFVMPPPPPPIVSGGGAATPIGGQPATFRHPSGNFPAAALFAMAPGGQGQNVLRLPPPTLAAGLSPQRPPPRMPMPPPQSLMSTVVMAPPPQAMNRLPPAPPLSSSNANQSATDRR